MDVELDCQEGRKGLSGTKKSSVKKIILETDRLTWNQKNLLDRPSSTHNIQIQSSVIYIYMKLYR